jgi:hypothetical protein
LDEGDEKASVDRGTHHLLETVDRRSVPWQDRKEVLQLSVKVFAVLKEVVEGQKGKKKGEEKAREIFRMTDD